MTLQWYTQTERKREREREADKEERERLREDVREKKGKRQSVLHPRV